MASLGHNELIYLLDLCINSDLHTLVLALEIASSFVVAFISHPIPFFFSFIFFFKLEADKASYLEVSLFAIGSILHVAICWWELVLVLFLWNCRNETKLVQVMAWHVNSVWPGDAIWQHRSGSLLAQVMACCLTALSHYLNQCSRIVSEVFGGG